MNRTFEMGAGDSQGLRGPADLMGCVWVSPMADTSLPSALV